MNGFTTQATPFWEEPEEIPVQVSIKNGDPIDNNINDTNVLFEATPEFFIGNNIYPNEPTDFYQAYVDVLPEILNISKLIVEEYENEQGPSSTYAEGGRVMSIDRLAQKLKRAYPDIRMRENEDSISVFEDFPTDRRGDSIADYYSESEDRVFGMVNHFDNFLKRNGYWAEWVNPEHFKIYKLNTYAKGGEIEDMDYEELMEVVFEENSSNQNEKLAKEIAKIQGFKYDAVEYADFHLVVRDYLDKSTNKNDDKSREVLLQAFENTGTSYAKGGKTPKFKVRKSFYSDIKDGKEEGEEYGSWTEGINKKTGTGEDKREVYHLKMDDDDYGRNYLLDSGTATEEYLKENAPIGYDKGFYVDEEVYVDFTDKDGNKKKGYMMVNSPDLAVRILRDKYNAVSIEDMLMEWEMEEKGKNFDDYTDSY
jgi:hypothetical protein